MQGLAITNKGIEDIAALEIYGMIKQKAEIREQCLVFPIEKLEDLCQLCYKAQSLARVLLLLDSFEINSDLLKEAKQRIDKLSLKEWLHHKKFVVRCIKQDFEDLSTPEIEGKIGELLLENSKNNKLKTKVDLREPDIIFLCYLNKNSFYLGIDFSGYDLSKRHYKIFQHPETLKGNVAYALMRIAKYKSGELLVDPFSGSGIIAIEAACYAYNFPVNYYMKDKFAFLRLMKFNFNAIDKKIKKHGKHRIFGFDHNVRYVESAKKNATIAGVNKYISFSRIAVEWHDTKLEENSVDVIIGNPPSASKIVPEKDIRKLYEELFYQADFIVAKNSRVLLASRDPELAIPAAEKYKFKVKEKREIYAGQQLLKVIVFER